MERDPSRRSIGKRPRRAFGIGLVAAVCAIAAVYTGWWFWMADRIVSGIEDWRTARASEGIRVNVAGIDISGFPGRISVRLNGAAIGAETGLWAVNVPLVSARISPFDVRRVEGAISGRVLAAAAYPRFAGAYEMDADAVTYTVDLATALNVNLVAAGIHVRRTDRPMDMTLDDMTLTAQVLPDDGGHRLTVDADSFVLMNSPLTPFGDTVQRAQTTLDILGPLLPIGATRDSLRHWSNAGGVAEVRSLLIDHGDLRLRGEGTVTLDAGLQPEGAFSARVGGYAEAIDALAGGGLMSPDEARVAKAVLGLMSSRPAPGRPREIEVPLTVQDRTLSAGPIRILRLPEIDWD